MSETAQISHLIDILTPLVSPLGFEIVHLEIENHRQKTLRLFIDRIEGSEGIGIEDCANVSRALDEPLDQMPDVDAAFGGAPYELEVSSPGVDRPLRTERDFNKFKGREIRVHVLRPLTGEELGNAEYQTKNPKQKNFLGTLLGLSDSAKDKVLLAVNLTGGLDKTQKKPSKKSKTEKAELTTNSAEGPVVSIPLPLISKANLEPDFDSSIEESR